MLKYKKAIFITSISLISFWLITPFVSEYIYLEFSNIKYENFYFLVKVIGFPLAVLCTLIGTLKEKDGRIETLGKIIGTLVVAVFSSFIILCSDMCQWTTNTLYINKQNTSVKIVARDLNCGAWDSDRPEYKFFKTREFPFTLILMTKIDTAQIDKSEWTKIANY
jgi:hypothetical protein